MKLLISAALSAILVLSSASAFAETPDFSKTAAAQSSYDFSNNQPAKGNNVQQSSAQHDFSKTAAASRQYDFLNNQVAEKKAHHLLASTQHDFSTTAAIKQVC
ncbi:hypothetical protein FM037_19340 [Shewanella psychropiezotolerans]|uniref:Uncharacterized protein n=1 Tax=Shewanella psychropiezotolerans TaxID=2593655 RepID=A0ABX5X0W4_9GAMM|nr:MULTISPECIES: hypothetical protein [Shewanella]MPY21378.1 hypothetical protein [Shewanella sp. YLB-07]MPY22165.1 hypothetical protein [Shewanella sp. YLB-07]QDO84983.1 hypothetical protein FM037_19340 [Shewanella psychropiezotolerans]